MIISGFEIKFGDILLIIGMIFAFIELQKIKKIMREMLKELKRLK